jgi:hypothetical protein
MNDEENKREDEKKVNEREGHMENDERADPSEEHQERQGEKNEAHKKFPPTKAILTRFSSGILERFNWGRVHFQAFPLRPPRHHRTG